MDNHLRKQISKLRREQGAKSPAVFARIYLAEHMKIKPSKAHEAVYEYLRQIFTARGAKIVIAGPRGFGKSTLITLAYVLYCICYRKEMYILILSHDKSSARQILENVRCELENNPKLVEDFPEIVRGNPWNQEQIQTLNGVRIAAYGIGQSVRGRRHRTYRPTLVVGDDLEKANLIFNIDGKEKLKAWYEKTVLEVGNSSTNFILIGNFFHPQCLLGDYLDPQKHPNWNKLLYRAIVSWPTNKALWDTWSKIYNSREDFENKKGPDAALAFYRANEAIMSEGAEILWPERWSLYELMEKHENGPIEFAAEYQNEPLDPSTCYFSPDSYQYWDNEYKTLDAFLRVYLEYLDFYAGCDPSMGGDKMKGDFTSIAIVGRDRRDGRLYHLLSDTQRIDPHEAIDLILGYCKRFRISRFAIEANQFQALMAREFHRRSQEANIYAPIEEIKNTGSKIARIQSLKPLMKSGTLVLNKMNPLFNHELRYFPKTKHDDSLDALELAVRMAEDRTIQVAILGGGGGWDDGWGPFVRAVRGY